MQFLIHAASLFFVKLLYHIRSEVFVVDNVNSFLLLNQLG